MNLRLNFAFRTGRLLRIIIAVAVVSQVHVASAQELNLVPRFVRQGFDPNYPTARTFLDACLNMDQWPSVRSVTGYLGYWDNLSDTDNATLQTCFQNMNAVFLGLSIEDGVWGAVCSTGDACFNIVQPRIAALRNLGAPPILLRMQEPFTKCKFTSGCTKTYIADQIARYMQLMRSAFPGIKIADIEAYPFNTYNELFADIDALNGATGAIGTARLEYFEIDHDWQRPDWTFAEIRTLKTNVNLYGMAFGVIFWNSPAPEDDTGDFDWWFFVLTQGGKYKDAGIVPDIYTVESWRHYIPHNTIPESDQLTFMGTVRDFRSRGFFPR